MTLSRTQHQRHAARLADIRRTEVLNGVDYPVPKMGENGVNDPTRAGSDRALRQIILAKQSNAWFSHATPTLAHPSKPPPKMRERMGVKERGADSLKSGAVKHSESLQMLISFYVCRGRELYRSAQCRISATVLPASQEATKGFGQRLNNSVPNAMLGSYVWK